MPVGVIINPGTGPIQDATGEFAEAAIKVFIAELAIGDVTYRRISDPGDGRFGFKLELANRRVDVDMPGLPIDRVRCGPGDNAWHFPRLYVDGSSWLWDIAVKQARYHLDGTFDPEPT